MQNKKPRGNTTKNGFTTFDELLKFVLKTEFTEYEKRLLEVLEKPPKK